MENVVTGIEFSEYCVGIDFGTSKVKATICTSTGKVVANVSRSWSTLQASKEHLSDWLIALHGILNTLFRNRPRLRGQVVSIAFTTIAPCIVVSSNDGNSYSNMLLYDENFPPCEKGSSRANRTQTIFEYLSRQLKATDESYLLTINGWLVQVLTGQPSIDTSSLGELFDGSDFKSVSTKLRLPPIKKPNEIVGTITSFWAEQLNLSPKLQVYAGGTDSLGIAMAASLRPAEELIYLGTFFSVMKSRYDFGMSDIEIPFGVMGYDWSISFPAGKLIERLASSQIHNYKLGRLTQIKSFMDKRISPVVTTQPSDIYEEEWKVGMPSISVLLLNYHRCGDHDFFSMLLHHFAERIAKHVASTNQRDFKIAGGFSSNSEITSYIAKVTGINIKNSNKIVGAEGAALMCTNHRGGK